MNNWVPIQYREFYDIPRLFIVGYGGRQFLFRCAFDDELDDYPDEYQVYLLPSLTEKDLEGDWKEIPLKAEELVGSVPAQSFQFDPSCRREIEATVLETVLRISRSGF